MNTLFNNAPPLAFLDWFHTPLRATLGIIALLIVVFVLYVLIRLTPDLRRYLRMGRM